MSSTKGGPQLRVSSPRPGRSTLMISAPRSPSICVAQGPARMRDRSSTRRCDRAPDISVTMLAGEGLNAGNGAPDDQRMHIMRSFIGVYRLEIHHVAHDVIFLGDAVATMHVT